MFIINIAFNNLSKMLMMIWEERNIKYSKSEKTAVLNKQKQKPLETIASWDVFL